jgi:hypothetical protein
MTSTASSGVSTTFSGACEREARGQALVQERAGAIAMADLVRAVGPAAAFWFVALAATSTGYPFRSSGAESSGRDVPSVLSGSGSVDHRHAGGDEAGDLAL